MSKLTKEMIEIAINNNKKCMVYDDNYVLLFKSFSIKDDEIDEYIQKIKLLQEQGINTPLILDYYQVNKGYYGYSKYVILEERAKGTNLNSNSNYLSVKQNNVNFDEISTNYLKDLDFYLDEIENRANASIDMYEKFINDYLSITNNNMQIDPKPLNFYFDKEEGFTFIDINGTGNNDLEYLPRYFLGAVLGYGLPQLLVESDYCMYIDSDRLNRLKEAYNTIITKVAVILIKHGYNKEEILKDSLNWTNQINRLTLIDNLDNLSNRLEDDFNRIKKETENKKEESLNDGDWTIGW